MIDDAVKMERTQTLNELIVQGSRFEELKILGYTPLECLISALKTDLNGYLLSRRGFQFSNAFVNDSLAHILVAEVTPNQLRRIGFPLGRPFQIFGIQALMSSKFTVMELVKCGYSHAELYSAATAGDYSPTESRALLIDWCKKLPVGPDLRHFGVSVVAEALQYSAPKILSCGFQLEELQRAASAKQVPRLADMFASPLDLEALLRREVEAARIVLPGAVLPRLAPTPASAAAELKARQADLAALPSATKLPAGSSAAPVWRLSKPTSQKHAVRAFGPVGEASAAAAAAESSPSVAARPPLNPVVRLLLLGKLDRSCVLSRLTWSVLQQLVDMLRELWASHIYADTVSAAVVGSVQFPKPRGINVNMMPIVMGALDSIPPELRHYAPLIMACPISQYEYGRVGYLTIQESAVENEGQSQRRAGLHTEGGYLLYGAPSRAEAAGADTATGTAAGGPGAAAALSAAKRRVAAVVSERLKPRVKGGFGAVATVGSYIEQSDPGDVAASFTEALAWKHGPYVVHERFDECPKKPKPVEKFETYTHRVVDSGWGGGSYEVVRTVSKGFQPEVQYGSFNGGLFMCSDVANSCTVWNARVVPTAAVPHAEAHRAWSAERKIRLDQTSWVMRGFRGSAIGEALAEKLKAEVEWMEPLVEKAASAAVEVAEVSLGCGGGVIGRHGNVEHLRALLGPGYRLGAGELVWLTDATPHESLPLPKGTPRAFFRLVTHALGAWYEEHSTPNPLGVLPGPSVRIVKGSKFTNSSPEPSSSLM